MPTIIETADASAATTTVFTIGVGQTVRGTIDSNGDHDWYRVELVGGRTYAFAMTGTGTDNVQNTILSLRSSNGLAVLAADDNGLPSYNSTFTFTPTASGSYYLDAAAAGAVGEIGRQYGIAVNEGTRGSLDLDMAAGVIDADAAWNTSPGIGVNVTYAFRLTDSGDQAGFSTLTSIQIAAVQSILALYAEVCGVTFTRVNAGGYADDATILFQNYVSTTDGAAAYAYYPGATISSARAGDVFLNTNSLSTTSLPVGGFGYFAIMHELGHALGLSHPGSYNAAPGTTISYARHAQFTQDTQMYSVMSYFDESQTGASSYATHSDTLMLLDVLALQNIYGVNHSTRSGDTVYGFNSNAGGVYDFAANTAPALCIWDGGGNDTLDVSGYSAAQVVNLNSGTFSSVGGRTSNISIAHGATIEHAIGGTGSDKLLGNGSRNSLRGGNGADTLDGGFGNDSLDGGAGDDVIFYDAADTAISVRGGAGFDQLVFTGAAPVAFALAAQEFEASEGRATDNGNLQSWSTSTRNFDVAWRLSFEVFAMDDGGTIAVDYDEQALTAWHAITTRTDAVSRIDWQITTFDGGACTSNNFDEASNEVWSTIVTASTISGATDFQVFTFDDGTSTATTFDVAGVFNWTALSTRHATNGAIDWQTFFVDAGSIVATDFDQDADQSWSTIVTRTALAGIDYQVFTFDDGSVTATDFDHSASSSWSQIITRFDVSGRLDWEVIINDNATRLRVDYDQQGAQTWAQDVYGYSIAGAVVSHVRIMDDGSTVYF